MKTIESIKKLVNGCNHHDKNFNNIKDYCDRESTKSLQCIFFLEDKARCEYFEKAVLPMNPQLEALYWSGHQAKQAGYELTDQDKKQIVEKESPVAGKLKIHCKRCKKVFLADNYRSQYCDNCKKYLNRERARDNMSRKRNIIANVNNQFSKTVVI